MINVLGPCEWREVGNIIIIAQGRVMKLFSGVIIEGDGIINVIQGV